MTLRSSQAFSITAASPAEYRDLMADALTTDDVVDVE